MGRGSVYSSAMRSAIIRPYFLLLTLALLVASALSGYAHRVPLAITDPALAAYAQMGGDIADLCGDAGEGAVASRGCDACRLVGVAALPALLLGWEPYRRPATIPVIREAQLTPRSIFPPRLWTPRGPPHSAA